MLTELEKRIQRYFFAEDKFMQNGMSEFWLHEMKFNRERITQIINERQSAEADSRQLKLFTRPKRKNNAKDNDNR